MPTLKQMNPEAGTAFVWILGCAGLISAADNWIIAPILPSIAAGLRISVPKAAAILAAYMIPYGLMQPIHGYLSERWGRAWLLRRLVLGLALGTVGCALSPSLFWLCGFRFITGFFAAGLIAVSLALIGDQVPVSLRQTYVGRFMGIVFLGQGISVGLGGLLAKFVSWRIIFLLFSVAAACADILLRRLPKDPPRSPKPGISDQFRQSVSSQNGKTLYILAFASGFMMLGIYGFSGAFLQRMAGLDPLQSGAVLMCFGFACMVAGSSAGRINAALGAKRTILTGVALGVSAALLLALSANWRAGWLAVVALGLGYVLVQSTLATLAFDTGSKGVSSALVGLGLFCGGGMSSALGGALLAQHGFRALWWVFGLGNLVLFLSVLGLHIQDPRRKQSLQPSIPAS